jgi:hypothetical protein
MNTSKKGKRHYRGELEPPVGPGGRRPLTLFGLTHLYAGVTGVIAIVYAFTFRELVSVLLIVFRVNMWSWQLIDIVSSICYGLLWLAAVLFCQHFYEKQLRAGGSWAPRLFFIVTGVQAALFAASLIAIRAIVGV